MSDFIPADVVENRTDFGIFERAPQRGINYAAYPATCSAMRAQRNLGFHLSASFLCRKPQFNEPPEGLRPRRQVFLVHSTTRLRVSCPTSRTSELSRAGARGCDVRTFTTGWPAPRRRSACRTADVLALKSHNLDAIILVRAPENFGDPAPAASGVTTMSFSAPRYSSHARQPRPRLDPEPEGAPLLDPQRSSAASERCCNCQRCPRFSPPGKTE